MVIKFQKLSKKKILFTSIFWTPYLMHSWSNILKTLSSKMMTLFFSDATIVSNSQISQKSIATSPWSSASVKIPKFICNIYFPSFVYYHKFFILPFFIRSFTNFGTRMSSKSLIFLVWISNSLSTKKVSLRILSC